MGVDRLLNTRAAMFLHVVACVDLLAHTHVGVDASVLLHILLVRHALDIVREKSWVSFRRSVWGFLSTLLHTWGAGTCRFTFVDDGVRLRGKVVNKNREDRACHATQRLEEGDSGLSGDRAEGVGGSSSSLHAALRAFIYDATDQFRFTVRRFLSSPGSTGLHRLEVLVAPSEAEHELIRRQRLPEEDPSHLHYLAVNDSDYIALGGIRLLFPASSVNHKTQRLRRTGLWQQLVDIFDGRPVALQEPWRVPKDEEEIKFYDLVQAHGREAFAIYSLLAHNDYKRIPGASDKVVLRAMTAAHKKGEFTVKGCIASLHTQVDSRYRIPEHEMMRLVDKALVMYGAPVVFDTAPDGSITGFRHLSPPGDISLLSGMTQAEVVELTSIARFHEVDANEFSTGGYDLVSLFSRDQDADLPSEEPPVPVNPPFDSTLSFRPRSTAPVPADLHRWNVAQCKEFLTERNRSTTGRLADLRAMIRAMHEVCTADDCLPSVESVSQERSEMEQESWKILNMRPFIKVEDERNRQMPRNASDAIDRWFCDKDADTARNLLQGLTRSVADVRVLFEEPCKETIRDGFVLHTSDMYITARIGFSYPSKKEHNQSRDVLAKVWLLRAGEEWDVGGVCWVRCLLPQGILTDLAVRKKLCDYRPCR